jgi:hypothetical protein
LRSRMNRKDSRPVLKTSGVGDSLAEFNYTAPHKDVASAIAKSVQNPVQSLNLSQHSQRLSQHLQRLFQHLQQFS